MTPLVAFWLGGLSALLAVTVAIWGDPPSSKLDREAFAALCRERPGFVFALVVFLFAFWPGLVLWLFAKAKKDDEPPGPPAPQA